jgi:putative ABC transport system permease protein
MVQHLFKLLWKKRKSNFLIMLEIFVAFFILFAVSSLSVYFYRGYVKPSGINAENVWVAYINFNSSDDSLNRQSLELLRQRIKGYKEIKSFSFGSHFPYGNSNSTRGFDYNGKNFHSEVMSVEEAYPSVLGIKMQFGEWFKNQDIDTMQKIKPVVITQHLKEEMFGNEEAIGKIMGEKENGQERIVGVIPNFKHQNDYQFDDNCIFMPVMTDVLASVILKTDPSVSADFEAQFARSIENLGKTWTVQIQHLEDMKKDKNQEVVIPLIIAFIVVGFLILNVAFGLFGVLFQNINRRRGEIGLRRAIGASADNISLQFIGEMVVLATFSVILGLFFAIQFPLLKVFDVAPSIYLTGILLAVLLVYLIVIACAWFPSRQAAAIQPAMALHEE